ncbi:MAG: Smr/MutS family protein [Prevotellaceae bacterium]|jgi:DNA mismatch repair protein MutS2|nr:Smr/MutS family protein [Prevotellaceae bacterium]
MIYPNNFEQKIGFDKICQMVDVKCITNAARQKLADAVFITNPEHLRPILRQVDEMRTICSIDSSFPDSGYVDVLSFLPKIRIEGTYLETSEIFALKRALETAKSIVAFFKRQEENLYPTLRRLVSSITVYPAVLDKIDSIINQHGKVRDNASPELLQIRRTVNEKQIQVSRRMQAIMKKAQSEGIVDESVSVSIRDGRAVIPVNAMNKRKIKGFIHDESATGRTAYIEPVEVVELNNEIRELEFAEQREIVKILIAFSNFLRPYIDDATAAGELIGEIDFIRAKAYFALEIDAVLPLLSDNLQLYLRKARHPLLMKTLKKEGKEVVPLDLQLDYEQHILLISGPNAGGKSVCLKTVGLLQYMLQCGFLIPVLENSEVGIFEHIFIDIGDEQSIENDLSTYSSHLMNMKYFLHNANSRTLILIDEFGTGTEPAAGGAIAEAVLAKLLASKSFGLITTHYTNLKYFASLSEGIINGAMLFDTQQIQPLFKLEIGVPGSSFAFEIARKIGLPEDVLKDAEAKLGDKHVGMEKSLREIARDKRYWESKRSKIRQTDKYLEEVTSKYEKELNKVKEMRQSIIKQAKEEAKALLADVNKQIENTIRTIRESQAEKEKTKEARQALEKLKTNITDEIASATDKEIERKIKQIQERQKRKEEYKLKQSGQIKTNKADEIKEDTPLQVGDKVKMKGSDTVGEIIKINEGSITVAFGHLITNAKPEKLVRISQNDYKKAVKQTRSASSSLATYDLSTKRLNFKPGLDVRGLRVTDALERVVSFIDEAMMFGIGEVKILHGKGNGILREEIRKYLSTFGNVLSYKDENVDMGGAGITVVKFN